MDNERLMQLRDALEALPDFPARLAALEAFCNENKVGCLSSLCPHEWRANRYGYVGFAPMASRTPEELAAFRDWAVDYYRRTNPLATIEGRMRQFEAKAARAPDRAKLVEAELRKVQNEHAMYYGAFATGQKYAREGDAPDFSEYHAYSPEVMQLLLGHANFLHTLYLEQPATAPVAVTADVAEAKGGPTVRQYVFQLIYLVSAKCVIFPPNGKVKFLLDRGVSLGYESGKNFKLEYYKVESRKITTADIADIEAATHLLDEHPAAKKLAEEKLRCLKSMALQPYK